MTNKKVIAIIIIFIVGGLFIYSFAATPSNNLKDDEGTISDNGNKYMDNNKDDDETEKKDTFKKEELTVLQKELDAAKSSGKYTDESIKAKQDLIDLANKASSEEEYTKIIESIKKTELVLKDDSQNNSNGSNGGSNSQYGGNNGSSNNNSGSSGNNGWNNPSSGGNNPSGGGNDSTGGNNTPTTPVVPETIGNSIVSASVSSTNGTDIINIYHEQVGTDIFLKGSIETSGKNYDGIYRIEMTITAPKILSEETLMNSKFRAMDNIYGVPTSEKSGYNHIANIGNIANEQAYITLSINLRGYEIKNENAPFRLAVDWGDGNYIAYSVYFNSITIE